MQVKLGGVALAILSLYFNVSGILVLLMWPRSFASLEPIPRNTSTVQCPLTTLETKRVYSRGNDIFNGVFSLLTRLSIFREKVNFIAYAELLGLGGKVWA